MTNKYYLAFKVYALLKINQLIPRKNKSLNNQLIGVIIGMMENDEVKEYFKNSKEFNKRIIQMIIQRIYDSISKK